MSDAAENVGARAGFRVNLRVVVLLVVLVGAIFGAVVAVDRVSVRERKGIDLTGHRQDVGATMNGVTR